MNIDGDFVERELAKVCTKTKSNGNDIAIICPFHADSNPSCNVHISGSKVPIGTYNCWSCGAKGGWKRLAEKLGIDTGENYVNDDPFAGMHRAHLRRLEAQADLNYNEFAYSEPWEHGNFRELPQSLLEKTEAKRLYDIKGTCYRIVWPVYHPSGNIRGYVSRRLDDNDFMPWKNSPGPWIRENLFPIKLLPRPTEVVVLVEGPYDALRLINKGIPALAILGAKAWTDTKVCLLEALRVQKVVICMDGDNAGRIVEGQIFRSLEGRIKRKRFRLPFQEPRIDPGNMDEEKLAALKDFCKL